MENKTYKDVIISRVRYNDYNDKGFGENAAINLPIQIIDFADDEESVTTSFTISFVRLESTLEECCGRDFRKVIRKIGKINKASLGVIDAFLLDAKITFDRIWHEKGEDIPAAFMAKGTFDSAGYHTIITEIELANTEEAKEELEDALKDFKDTEREDKVFKARLTCNMYD